MGWIGKIVHRKLRAEHLKGSKIEMYLGDGEWIHWKNPTWDLGIKYRIKQDKK